MPEKNKHVDRYIARSQPFARPILLYLRQVVHTACPAAEEKMKWSFPHFDYKGAMMCSMAAFQQHCAFTFWKAALLKDTQLMENARKENAMGHFGRITSIKDLPAKPVLIAYVKEAMALNDAGIKITKTPASAVRSSPAVPSFFITSLKKNKKILSIFEGFSPSQQREYLDWVGEAKTAETRTKRLKTALQWISEGKTRNWKYKPRKRTGQHIKTN